MRDAYEVRTVAGNRDGSLPSHHDIYLRGEEDSIATVWSDLETALYLKLTLEQRARKPEPEEAA